MPAADTLPDAIFAAIEKRAADRFPSDPSAALAFEIGYLRDLLKESLAVAPAGLRSHLRERLIDPQSTICNRRSSKTLGLHLTR